MRDIYQKVLPQTHMYLKEWEIYAERIPNAELRRQALMSIKSKTFHCEGGSIYGLLTPNNLDSIIEFIVAYQTISDYLDNLCDRSTSLNPTDFKALHESMLHALSPHEKPHNYYRYREEQEDGGYLEALVTTCQKVLKTLPHYEKIAPHLVELAHYYIDLQVHKHVKEEERIPRLVHWYEQYKEKIPEMSWYEFSACAGSTLGIFCLVSYASREEWSENLAQTIKESYFPWVQGLHILLDYFIDQEEDLKGGDLNFCFYYENDTKLAERFAHFVREADKSVANLPDQMFHRSINHGLLGIYLADEKVKKQKHIQKTAKNIIQFGGRSTFFFYLNGWIYRKMKKR
jgi:tetraprenyl-beta-curcumene synthase